MAVNDASLNSLRTSPQFIGRVRMAVTNYAVYLNNQSTTGALGNWSAEVLSQASAVEAWTARMLPFVLINVAAGSSVTGSGETLDVAATDAALRSQVETQIQAAVGA